MGLGQRATVIDRKRMGVTQPDEDEEAGCSDDDVQQPTVTVAASTNNVIALPSL